MVEYLYNAIRARAGSDIVICAAITNDLNEVITEGCRLTIFASNREDVLFTVDGEYVEADMEWHFAIDGEQTKELNGRYWYCISQYDKALCFKEPVYLS